MKKKEMGSDKKAQTAGLFAIVLLLVAALAFGAVFLYRDYVQGRFAARVAEMGPGGTPPETIEALKSAIKTYEDRIERHVNDAAQAGVYWKILAIRLMDRQLYTEALEALEEAIRYMPEDASLHYQYGVAASIVAKSSYDTLDRTGVQSRLFSAAENAHLRAISLDKLYARPRYALAVLYVFELDRPEDAITYLLDYLQLRNNDIDARFVLARAYYMTGSYQNALDLYDEIIATTQIREKKAEAEKNKETILELMYE